MVISTGDGFGFTFTQRLSSRPRGLTAALSSALRALGTTLGDCDRHDEAIGHLIESVEMCRRLVDEGDKNLEDVDMGAPHVDTSLLLISFLVSFLSSLSPINYVILNFGVISKYVR